MQWSYGEMAPNITGLGYDWAVEQTGKALGELIDLLGQATDDKLQ
jgi:putative DNA methylase